MISGVSPLGSTGSASMVRHDFTVGGWGLGAQPRCSPHGNQKAQGRGGAVYTYGPIPPEPLDTTVKVCFPPQSHSLESCIDIQKCAFPVTL